MSWACYRAWPFFVQDRVGRQACDVPVLSRCGPCRPDTDHYADKYSIGESRIPPIMRTVRRLHLDELPQLLHVVAGQMAFVGPRPEMPNLHATLPAAFAAERVSVLPGLTGLWQISPHSLQLIGSAPSTTASTSGTAPLGLDAWILYRTLLKMTVGRPRTSTRAGRDRPASPVDDTSHIVLVEAAPVPSAARGAARRRRRRDGRLAAPADASAGAQPPASPALAARPAPAGRRSRPAAQSTSSRERGQRSSPRPT